MNSEELELSLRTEFESYLNGVRAEMKRELTDFRQKVEAEADKHKSQIDDAFQSFSDRLDSGSGVDQALKESVVEHLRLARDDGAQLAASAAQEAENMDFKSESSGDFNDIRDAVADISSKTSQSAILRSLTDHCARFTGRGAFFIVKNDNFLGWQIFGKGVHEDENTTREIQIPVSSDTILGEAVRDLHAVHGSQGSHKGNSEFLSDLRFEASGKMLAVPLVARGRGVAVLFADGGPDDTAVNAGAIETLVRIASMTVELLAAAVPTRTQTAQEHVEAAPITKHKEKSKEQEAVAPIEETYSDSMEMEAVEAPPMPHISKDEETFEAHDAVTHVEEIHTEPQIVEPEAVQMTSAEGFETATHIDDVSVAHEESLDDESYLMNEPSEEIYVAEEITPVITEPEFVETGSDAGSTDFAFVGNDTAESMEFEHVSDDHVEAISPVNGNSNGHIAEPDVEAESKATSGGKKRGRKVDLPIEVEEGERDKHTRARSFARLLVSEIKLYHPDQVNDGRESNDLYDRLREAIDRSREMYNQRVADPVASRFDYFHYELVNGLAEGDEARLGGSYPGSSI